LRVVLEKVELHDFGDAQKQGAVEGGFAEDFIDVVAGAGNLPGQPARATLVAFQLRLDEAADVDVSRIYAVCSHKKPRTFCLRSRLGKNLLPQTRKPTVKNRGRSAVLAWQLIEIFPNFDLAKKSENAVKMFFNLSSIYSIYRLLSILFIVCLVKQ